MIKLSVALPVYNSKNIVWLAMESLCNQKGVNFQWELLVCEEQDGNSAGNEFFSSYMDRLKLVGCLYIKYIPLTSWIPLAQKWRLMGKAAANSSIVFLLQAADCYSQPNRLRRAYKALGNKQADWYQCPRGFFYHIFTDQVIEYDHFLYGPRSSKLTALNMATLTGHARKLPFSDKRKGVDGWFLSTISNPKIYVDRHLGWKLGIDTQGLNNISKKRAAYFQTTKPPFRTTGVKIDAILPGEIITKLYETRDQALNFIESKQAKDPTPIIINCIDDIQDNADLPFVYVWVKAPQVWNELAISIKSVRKFYNNKARIFVVGDDPNLKGVIHIPANLIKGFAYCRSIDIYNKLNIIANSPLIDDNFIYMYDDIVLLKKIDSKVFKLKIAHDLVEDPINYFKPGTGVNPSGRWQELFKQTMWMLQKRGLPLYNYETHLPRLLNKNLVIKTLAKYKMGTVPSLFNTLYFNTWFEKPDIQLNKINFIKASAYRPFDNELKLISELRGKTFLNFDNPGLNDLLKKQIIKILNS